jgi:hypothetical protein
MYKLRDLKRSEWESHAGLVLNTSKSEKRYNPIVLKALRDRESAEFGSGHWRL